MLNRWRLRNPPTKLRRLSGSHSSSGESSPSTVSTKGVVAAGSQLVLFFVGGLGSKVSFHSLQIRRTIILVRMEASGVPVSPSLRSSEIRQDLAHEAVNRRSLPLQRLEGLVTSPLLM